MNNLIIKDIYKTALLCKYFDSRACVCDDILGTSTDYDYSDIENIILKNTTTCIKDDITHLFNCNIFRYKNIIFIIFNSFLSYNYHKEMIKLKDNIYLHKGLLDQYIYYQDQIYKNILELDRNNLVKNIYVCGHGMGAAIATIAAAILGERYKNIYLISCFSFESPKIGNKQFKKYFNLNVKCNYRIVINDDLLDQHQYYHVSDPIKLEKESIYECKMLVLSKKTKIMNQLFLHCSQKKETTKYIGLDEYILRLQNIRNIYKQNMLNKSSPSNSSGSSGSSKKIETIHNET